MRISGLPTILTLTKATAPFAGRTGLRILSSERWERQTVPGLGWWGRRCSAQQEGHSFGDSPGQRLRMMGGDGEMNRGLRWRCMTSRKNDTPALEPLPPFSTLEFQPVPEVL